MRSSNVNRVPEAQSRGELRNGHVCENQCHPLVTVRDGLIAELKEYMDTQHAQSIWFSS